DGRSRRPDECDGAEWPTGLERRRAVGAPTRARARKARVKGGGGGGGRATAARSGTRPRLAALCASGACPGAAEGTERSTEAAPGFASSPGSNEGRGARRTGGGGGPGAEARTIPVPPAAPVGERGELTAPSSSRPAAPRPSWGWLAGSRPGDSVYALRPRRARGTAPRGRSRGRAAPRRAAPGRPVAPAGATGAARAPAAGT